MQSFRPITLVCLDKNLNKVMFDLDIRHAVSSRPYLGQFQSSTHGTALTVTGGNNSSETAGMVAAKKAA